MENQTNLTLPDDDKKWRVMLGIFATIAFISFLFLVNSLKNITDYLGSINRLELASANIVRNINDATFSKDPDISEAAYEKLIQEVSAYNTALNNAENAKMGASGVIGQLKQDWRAHQSQINYVLDHQNDINALQDSENQVISAINSIQDYYIQAAQGAATAGQNQAVGQIAALTVQAERLGQTLQMLSTTTSGDTQALQESAQNLQHQLTALSNQYGATIPSLVEALSVYNSMISPILTDLETLNSPAVQARENARQLATLATDTQYQLSQIDRDIISQWSILIPALGVFLGTLGGIFALYGLLKQAAREQKRLAEVEALRQRQELEFDQDRARRMEEENEKSQSAILRLLDELSDLAEGDLTVNATVTEDFTGAIADSVNYAILQLRELVSAINTTADRVAQSSAQTQNTAVELAEASEHQAQEIAGVSAAINQMAVSIDQVSANASESAAVAQRSVAIAYNGAEVVQRTITGMNTIREQIQETSKRIKRLGESSQEIGDIVSLINDIADQTNILALNAAIQASMAGEAGRGFAVVADEVQRLAERSASATRQIETLVKTIQADTNEAVASMESTTSEVVKGANLARDAGEALQEVQTVSNTLADLIQNISNAAQQQATSAGHISGTMNVIQDITSQTSSGTLATARSVGRLNEMAAELQEKVLDFKLGDEDARGL